MKILKSDFNYVGESLDNITPNSRLLKLPLHRIMRKLAYVVSAVVITLSLAIIKPVVVWADNTNVTYIYPDGAVGKPYQEGGLIALQPDGSSFENATVSSYSKESGEIPGIEYRALSAGTVSFPTITGTPTAAGEYSIVIKFTLSDNNTVTATFTITINPASTSDAPTKDSSSSSSSKKKSSSDSKPASWILNPDEMYLGSASGFGANAKLGKQEQGALGKAAFAAARPAGWTEAFTFNMTINDKQDYSQKTGRLVLTVPTQYIKAGRTFAVLALDQNGTVLTYPDLDHSDATVTVDLNHQGYAFALIYTN